MKKLIWITLTALAAFVFWNSLQAGNNEPEAAESETLSEEARLLIGELVAIPSGSFTMGDVIGDGSKFAKPVHEVTINAFTMQAHEVTWAQYQPCIDALVCPEIFINGDASKYRSGSQPVINVSYNDIVNVYIPWLNKETGLQFRLPSESEWEYAARAGTKTKYFWGNHIGENLANCRGCGSAWDKDRSAPVKSFLPNAFGLYDMHGNVSEVTSDCWNSSKVGAPRDQSPWLEGECIYRVVKGGGWASYPFWISSDHRTSGMANKSGLSAGFRLVQID